LDVSTIDLNADLGEECADDEALLEVVTSANVAAGGHAGGGAVLARTVHAAAEAGVAVGAHPSYVDRSGFGRTSHLSRMDQSTLTSVLHEQIDAVLVVCASEGVALAHVKAHGALYHDANGHQHAAEALLDAVDHVAQRVGHPVPVVGPPTGMVKRLSTHRGLPYVAEAFADRAYRPDGTLVPRGERGALVADPEEAALQAISVARHGLVTTTDGQRVEMRAETICLHGDTPGSVDLARRVRASLEADGIDVASIRWI
jgi:5-oxoprolinase (ATP-hydrolysing) subunit A